ncbi:hypothetical protein ACLMAJ_22800 [Nocardia sp. KC 131]|uniref:hypothetical protein n=1 Tax=Nocardia arseniciresistens TaxID=3392119 RepID=UPI00398E4296
MGHDAYGEAAAAFRRLASSLAGAFNRFGEHDAAQILQVGGASRGSAHVLPEADRSGELSVRSMDTLPSVNPHTANFSDSAIHTADHPIALPPLTMAEASELTAHVSRLRLPFGLNVACGRKADAILYEMRKLGVSEHNIGIARSFIPDLSEAGMRRAVETGATMHKNWRATPVFSERMKMNTGNLVAEDETVEFEGSRFARRSDGSVIISSPDGENHWPVWDTDRISHFFNHTAATIRISRGSGEVIGVIDPVYDTTRPLSLKEWARCQNYSEVNILTGRMTDPVGSPFHVHTELMSETRRAEYEALIQTPGSTYSSVMKNFFNLEDLPASQLGSTSVPAFNEYSNAQTQSFTILSGNSLNVLGVESSVGAAPIENQLSSLMSYQKWLSLTGGIP